MLNVKRSDRDTTCLYLAAPVGTACRHVKSAVVITKDGRVNPTSRFDLAQV